jgi:hypothetical protein
MKYPRSETIFGDQRKCMIYVDDSSELSYNVGTVQLDRAVSSLRLRINGPLKLK